MKSDRLLPHDTRGYLGPSLCRLFEASAAQKPRVFSGTLFRVCQLTRALERDGIKRSVIMTALCVHARPLVIPWDFFQT